MKTRRTSHISEITAIASKFGKSAEIAAAMNIFSIEHSCSVASKLMVSESLLSHVLLLYAIRNLLIKNNIAPAGMKRAKRSDK